MTPERALIVSVFYTLYVLVVHTFLSHFLLR